MISRRRFLQASLFTIASPLLLSLPACGSKIVETALPKGSKVSALGDSLTFGYGVGGSEKGADYPSQLAKLTAWKVSNDGVSGDTSQDVLNRLDKVLTDKPKLVLLGIGGNDVLQRVSPATTKDNIIDIVKQLTEANIPVILIAEPHFSVSAVLGRASDNPIYKQIIEEKAISKIGVLLYVNGWSSIMSDESLKSDKIHANEAGYRKFAEGLYGFLQEVGYASSTLS